MKRALLFAALGLVLIAGAVWFNRETIVLAALGLKTEKRTLVEQQALLAPFIHVYEPRGARPPYPVVVQFHGCAGWREDFMTQWARVANDEGFLVVGVDSNGARGIDREEALSSVCAGKVLIGQERAGDVAAALALVAARDDVDPGRIIAAGWSHGAWSLMDYLALASNGAAPPSIKGAAPSIDLGGIVLFYPYCGEGAWSRIRRWRIDTPVLAFVAGKDTIVDGEVCRAEIEKISFERTPVDLVFYDEADHVFDDAGLLGTEYAHYYSPKEAADAERRYRGFLNAIKNRP